MLNFSLTISVRAANRLEPLWNSLIVSFIICLGSRKGTSALEPDLVEDIDAVVPVTADELDKYYIKVVRLPIYKIF